MKTSSSAGQATAQSLLQASEPDVIQGTIRIHGDNAYPVFMRRLLPTDAPRARYPGFKQETLLLKSGTIRREGAQPLSCDIVFERDVTVTLGDGTTIYTDGFRPAGDQPIPGIVAWSPYGKQIGGQCLDGLTNRSNVPLALVSDLQKFEAPDAASWVAKGYAILNPDARGAYASEGNITYWGRQLSEDGHDFIEWAADQSWSNGKIGMAGNSFLAISQWHIAASQPPHLSAIAPWEGATDILRAAATSLGLGNLGFEEVVMTTFPGNNYAADTPRMHLNNSLDNIYWRNRTPQLSNITVPAYVVASYTNFVHTRGTFDGFRQISSEKKWLRVHNTHEWQDFYVEEHTEELRAFFDRYLKDSPNDWERTPQVRISVLDPGSNDTVGRVVKDWPVPDLQSTTLFIGSNKTLTHHPKSSTDSVSYEVSANTTGILFSYTVPNLVEIIGYVKIRLWVEANGSDDMELAIIIENRDANGNPFPRVGSAESTDPEARGNIRVSRRALEKILSTPSEPYLLHEREDLLSAEEIVPVDIGLSPTALRFHPGEKIVLTVSPTVLTPSTLNMGFGVASVSLQDENGTFVPGAGPNLKQLAGNATNPLCVDAQRTKTSKTRNNGSHILHFGARYDSHVLLPLNITGSHTTIAL
ncbi:hydrolase [Colletotrichum salicis]|uniref:Hydrolase n=1 Tax=Colletotrichum salicis TaxID=1209931 RepID=A0A135U7R4_9PEZI|nr:hydrolase [Colletotrichum salicis]